MKIGFIGLGTMGAPMAKNLLRAGFEVTVHNRTRDKEEALVAAGAGRAASPREVAADADVVVTNVSDTPDVEAVVLGEDGAVHGLKEGSVLIDVSTISPSVTRAIATTLAERGVDMLDAPVSGGSEGRGKRNFEHHGRRRTGGVRTHETGIGGDGQNRHPCRARSAAGK